MMSPFLSANARPRITFTGDLTIYQMYEAVHRNFGDYLGEHAVLISTLCTKGIADTIADNIAKKKDVPTEVANAFGHLLPLDVRISLNDKSELQIVNASNSLAKILKLAWLNKKSTTYYILLYDRNLDLVAKAVTGRQINLRLSGASALVPSVETGQVYCHVDCTKLVVNGETLIDAATPVWSKKPYKHIIDVETGEEVKIHVEWKKHEE